MSREMDSPAESSLAKPTNKRLVVGVHEHVRLEVGPSSERLVACLAAESLLSGVHELVLDEAGLPEEGFVAQVA